MNSFVIFDLDGCLADDRRRQALIDLAAPDPWEAYHSECDKDPLINANLLELTSDFDLIIFTARPEQVRAKTERWLREVAKIKPRWVFMRSSNCRKASPALKRDFLESLFKASVEPEDIVVAFDDREDVLTMYAMHGVRTFKVGYPAEVNSDAQKS